jgi:hypothetical protein
MRNLPKTRGMRPQRPQIPVRQEIASKEEKPIEESPLEEKPIIETPVEEAPLESPPVMF